MRKEDNIMEKALEKLLESIVADYYRWTKASWDANGYDMDGFDSRINKFRNGLEVKIGRKFIKILTDRSVWGFVNLTHDKFEKGDIFFKPIHNDSIAGVSVFLRVSPSHEGYGVL